MSDVLIKMRGVTRQYDPDNPVGVSDVDLDINAGEYVAIVGPSGAGKSTLLQLIGLLDTPDSGRYWLEGRDLRVATEQQRDKLRSTYFGLVFQASHVLPHLSAHANAALGMVSNAVPLNERSDSALQAMQRLGIEARSNVPAGLLSGGERQRLAVARALATKPKVVLADEPTGSLDSASGAAVLADLERLHEAGTTVLIITHDEDIAARAQRRIRVVDGRIVEDTRPGDVERQRPIEHCPPTTPADRKPQHGDSRWATRVADVLSEALTEVLLRAVRTVFLVLAFALGVGGLITSVGLSETAAVQVTDKLEAAAFDEVRIALPDVSQGQRSEQLRLSRDRVRELPHVVHVTASVQLPITSIGVGRFEGQTDRAETRLQLIAVDDAFFATNDLTLSRPRSAELFASEHMQSIAVVGPDAQRELQLPSSGEGKTLLVGGHRVDVLDTFTTGVRRPGLENAVLVPLSMVPTLPAGQAELLIRTQPGYPAALAEAVPFQLDPADPGQYRVQTVADLRNLSYGVATDLDTLVGIMAGVLLLLAVVSASTSMYLSVLARTREIALRRALGISRTGIAARFLTEGLLVGAMGGATGAIGGISGVLLVSWAQEWTPQIASWLVPVGLAIGVLAGVLSALVPALIASRQSPSAAL